MTHLQIAILGFVNNQSWLRFGIPAHPNLSPCVLFRYDTMLNIVVRGDSEPIPQSFPRSGCGD